MCRTFPQSQRNSKRYQLVGQWHAALVGLGDIFDPAHRKSAARAIYDINFKSMRDVANPCRVFATNDEKGVMICEWDEGKYKPQIPLPYTEECMTGFEYAAAQLMIQEGFIDEGVQIVEAIRERYDGKKRNPYAEIECGSSYARSMASFTLPAVFARSTVDMTKGVLGFDPIVKGDFSGVWFAADAWGMYEKKDTVTKISVLAGKLPLKGVLLPYLSRVSRVECDGKTVTFNFNPADGTVSVDCTAERELLIEA